MTGHNPKDRSKLGSKRHILTDKQVIPLSIFITSANTHDVIVATNIIDNIVIKRPSHNKSKHKQNRCVDKSISFQRSRTRNHQKRIHTTYTTQKRRKKEK